jgi:hypothetical protein
MAEHGLAGCFLIIVLSIMKGHSTDGSIKLMVGGSPCSVSVHPS